MSNKVLNEVLTLPIKIIPRSFVEKTIHGEYSVNSEKPIWLIGAPSPIYGVDVEITGIDSRNPKQFIIPVGDCLLIPTHEILLSKVPKNTHDISKYIIEDGLNEYVKYDETYNVLIQIRKLQA